MEWLVCSRRRTTNFVGIDTLIRAYSDRCLGQTLAAKRHGFIIAAAISERERNRAAAMYVVRKEVLAEYVGNLEPFINQIADYALYMLDTTGGVLSWNAGAERLLGYTAQEVIGCHVSEFYTVDDLGDDHPRRALETATRDGTSQVEELRVRKDSTRFWATEITTALKDEAGNLQGFVKLTRDITERKTNEAALRAREAKYRTLFENSHDAILLTKPIDGAILAANPAACRVFGRSEQELISLRREQVLWMADPRVTSAFSQRAVTGAGAAELTFIHKDGSHFEARVSSKVFTDETGQHLSVTTIQDITERKRAEEALRRSEERLRLLYENAPLGIAECTLDHKFTEANSRLVEILGYTKDEITRLSVADVTHPGESDRTVSCLQSLTTGEADTYVIEKRYIRKDRSLVWVNETGALASINGRPQRVIMTVEDITSRKKAEEDLKQAIEYSYHQANHDMLTGLANRAACQDRLKEALAYARRDEHMVALHLLDLDGFKSINDALGHQFGDLLLEHAARRLTSHVRATDLVARLGGDEFVVIQTHLAEPEAAGVLARKLVADLGRKYALDNKDVQSGASIGIALYPVDADDPGELMKCADLALYDAKDRGRCNYQFYREELGAAWREAQRVEQDLVRALQDDEFRLHYQPEFDLKSGRIVGVEVLLRWRHPARGMLPAAAFIQDAERARLMPSIGEWTFRNACRQFKAWVDAGLAAPLALNLSPRQLRDPRLPDTLARILGETGLLPSSLQLEMPETVLWDPKFSKRMLTRLKDRGFRLSLDQFGAEMTTLPTLDRFPLDALKPDQRLVRRQSSHERESAILSAIIGVAHDLKITVCADGVETRSQLDAAKEQGCDSAQGHVLSVPLEPDAMGKLVQRELAH